MQGQGLNQLPASLQKSTEIDSVGISNGEMADHLWNHKNVNPLGPNIQAQATRCKITHGFANNIPSPILWIVLEHGVKCQIRRETHPIGHTKEQLRLVSIHPHQNNDRIDTTRSKGAHRVHSVEGNRHAP